MTYDTLSPALALGAILMQLLAVGFFMLITIHVLRATKTSHYILKLIARYAVMASGAIALAATFGSFYYSEIVGFEPCSLCWYQRIFMVPLVVLFALALLKREEVIVDYALSLSCIGSLIALYHSYIQYVPTAAAPCSASGISCTARLVFEYGYVTLPLMSFTMFLLISMILSIHKFSTPHYD